MKRTKELKRKELKRLLALYEKDRENLKKALDEKNIIIEKLSYQRDFFLEELTNVQATMEYQLKELDNANAEIKGLMDAFKNYTKNDG